MQSDATIQFRCQCGRALRVGVKHAGARAKCPACGTALTVPQPQPMAAVSAVAAAAVQPPVALQGVLCAICQSPLGSDEAATNCPSCHAPYHSDCWQENGGCAVYGCVEVAPTEKREALEIPVSYWGQEDKPCPGCGQTILAAALRCRHCGAMFDTARPEASEGFQARIEQKRRLPALKRTVLWMFALSLLPCTAPFAAVYGWVWYFKHRADLVALPGLYLGICRLALAVGLGQVVITTLMATLFVAFRT